MSTSSPGSTIEAVSISRPSDTPFVTSISSSEIWRPFAFSFFAIACLNSGNPSETA